MVQMKPPKFQHPLRPPPTLFLLRLLFASPPLSLSLFPLLPLCPRPGFLDTRALSLSLLRSPHPVLFLFFPFLFLSLSASRCPRNQPAKWSRARWLERRIRETRGASAGVAMTQSQRGPMDLAGVRESVRRATIGRGSSRGCVTRGAHHLRLSLRGGMPKCAPGCNIIPLGG